MITLLKIVQCLYTNSLQVNAGFAFSKGILYKTFKIKFRIRTIVGVIKICALFFRELLILGCINLQNLCAHQQEELLTIPKHLQLVKIGTWLKIIQSSQVGALLANGHRDFEETNKNKTIKHQTTFLQTPSLSILCTSSASVGWWPRKSFWWDALLHGDVWVSE